MDRVDLCDAVKLHRVPFILNPDDEWSKFPDHLKGIVQQPWSEFKYFVDSGDTINTAITNVPNNCGGIYLFYIKICTPKPFEITYFWPLFFCCIISNSFSKILVICTTCTPNIC